MTESDELELRRLRRAVAEIRRQIARVEAKPFTDDMFASARLGGEQNFALLVKLHLEGNHV